MVNKWFQTTEEGELSRFGYSPKYSLARRKTALNKAIKSDRNSGLEVFHKLVGLANVTENSQPTNSKKYRSDSRYVKKEFYNTKYW